MIEFLFFQKVIVENNVENDFKDFLTLADEQDEFEWDESHFDGRILKRKRTVTWVKPGTSEVSMKDGRPDQTVFNSKYSFIKYLQNIKYQDEYKGMIPAVRKRLDEFLLNETKRSKYINLLKSKYSEIIKVGNKKHVFSKYLDLEDFLESYKSKLELIIGEEINSQDSAAILGHGLNLKLALEM